MYYWNPKSAQIQTVSTLNPSQLLSCFSLSIPLQGCIKEDTGGGEISPGDNFAGDNFARGKFRHP